MFPDKRRPAWLDKKTHPGRMTGAERALGGVNTVCREAKCPNISECWERKTATFLILGNVCTRRCGFCAVSKGVPGAPDPEETAMITAAALRLGLRRAVITSPTRDDLSDGGASQFASAARALAGEGISVEILVPDFGGSLNAWDTAARSAADIIGHNMETVSRLYGTIRPGAEYERSLRLLSHIKSRNPRARTKSGIMLGLGEKTEEIVELFRDLIDAGCSYLSIGQYLQGRRDCAPVTEYIPPGQFDLLKEEALSAGFEHVESGPYVRSSYMSERYGN